MECVMLAQTQDLTQRTARAAPWRLGAAMVAAASQFAAGVLLARLLPPAEFGLMALALVLVSFVQPLGDLGIGNAVVQRSLLNERHVRGAFTVTVLLGLAVTALVAIAAPLAAAVTGNTGIAPVLRVLSAVFVFRGFGVVAEALLRRRLDFRRLFFIDACSYLFGYGMLAIALAFAGFGVWSLVWGALLQSAIASLALLISVRHDVRPLLVWRESSDLLGFGATSATAALVNSLALNGDSFVVGRMLGPAALGLYARAYGLMNAPHAYLSGVMSSVLFPAFAHVQREPDRVRRGYLLITRATAMVAAPSLAVLAVAAPHLIATLYGPRWSGVVLPLQILCIAGYFRALYHPGGLVVQSMGRVYGEVARQAIYAVLMIAGTSAAARYGLPWVAVAVGGAILFMYGATGQAVMRATGTAWRHYLASQVAAVVTAAVSGAVALGARLLLESHAASSVTICIGVVAAAAVPWSIGMLWELSDPAFSPLRSLLPGWPLWLTGPWRRSQRHRAEGGAAV
jgi:PST family polysaccharide transporter